MSGYYARLPKLTDLTTHQRIVINDTNPIFVSGLAGVGKSVCLMYRYIKLLNSKENSHCAYITFTKTLKEYTKSVVAEKNLTINEIHCAINFCDKNKQNYKAIIIDEAQDLEINLLATIKNKTKSLSVGADFTQQIYPNKVTKSELENLLSLNSQYALEVIFRNTFNILNFIVKNGHKTLYALEELESLKQKNKIGTKPTLCIGADFILDIIKEYGNLATHNIAILCYGKEKVEKYHKFLEQNNIQHTYYHSYADINDVIKAQLSSLHITTFHSAKGLEFDTVIIPDFESYKKHFTNLKDKDEFTLIQRKALYVAITRARQNLYLVANSEIDFLKDSSTYAIQTRRNLIDIDDEIPF